MNAAGLSPRLLYGAFTKAFAVFIRELERETAREARARQPGRTRIGRARPVADRQLLAEVEAEIAAAEAGRAPTLLFSPGDGAAIAGNRLRKAAADRGVTQKQLAAKLGVTPAVINRVFKQPERSKVSTLQKIADALGADLRDII